VAEASGGPRLGQVPDDVLDVVPAEPDESSSGSLTCAGAVVWVRVTIALPSALASVGDEGTDVGEEDRDGVGASRITSIFSRAWIGRQLTNFSCLTTFTCWVTARPAIM
jgi:hypothetical protein